MNILIRIAIDNAENYKNTSIVQMDYSKKKNLGTNVIHCHE